MFLKIIIAIVAIFTLLIGWLVVQSIARLFSNKHPELGPAREEGQGCGSSCGCRDKTSCKRQEALKDKIKI